MKRYDDNTAAALHTAAATVFFFVIYNLYYVHIDHISIHDRVFWERGKGFIQFRRQHGDWRSILYYRLFIIPTYMMLYRIYLPT